MDTKTFIKICKDAGMIDRHLTTTGLDIIFNHKSVKPKGDKFIDFCQFEVTLDLIAEKRQEPNEVIRERFLNLTNPVLTCTKADYVRFHDDKSTYTGSHRFDKVALPGGGHSTNSLASVVRTLSPASVVSKPGSSNSLAGGSPTNLAGSGKTLQRAGKQCVSLDEPIADNSQLYKVFGLSTKAGKLIRKLYSKDLVSSPKSPSPTLSSASLRRTMSLPAVGGADNGDNLLCASPRGSTKSWKSPFLIYLQEQGPPSQSPRGIVQGAASSSPRRMRSPRKKSPRVSSSRPGLGQSLDLGTSFLTQ